MNLPSTLLCSICIPVFNEEECISKFLNELLSNLTALEEKFGFNFEIIAVDDGSSDSTLKILTEYSLTYQNFFTHSLESNSGHQAAILCALYNSNGDIIITMDSDGQDPPECIENLITEFLTSHKRLLLPRRQTRNDPFLKKLTAWLFYRFVVLLGLPATSRDAGDFRLISSRVKNLLLSQPNSLQYLRGQLFTLNIPYTFVRIDRKSRIAGTTKYTLSKMVRLATSSAYVVDPIRIAQFYISFSFFLVFASFIASVTFFALKILSPDYYSSGVTTLALLMLLSIPLCLFSSLSKVYIFL